MINADLSRAARGLLNWTQEDLSRATGISKVTIIGFEKGASSLSAQSAALIKNAFFDAGVEFPDQLGVRKRTEGVQILEGEGALQTLWDDVFMRMKDVGGEILITHVDEARTLKQAPGLVDHIKRLKKHGITERLLSCEGDEFFLMPKKCYRWMSQELFTGAISTYVYQDRVALQMWNTSTIILIHHRGAAEAERQRFEMLWQSAKIPG